MLYPLYMLSHSKQRLYVSAVNEKGVRIKGRCVMRYILYLITTCFAYCNEIRIFNGLLIGRIKSSGLQFHNEC